MSPDLPPPPIPSPYPKPTIDRMLNPTHGPYNTGGVETPESPESSNEALSRKRKFDTGDYSDDELIMSETVPKGVKAYNDRKGYCIYRKRSATQTKRAL